MIAGNLPKPRQLIKDLTSTSMHVKPGATSAGGSFHLSSPIARMGPTTMAQNVFVTSQWPKRGLHVNHIVEQYGI